VRLPAVSNLCSLGAVVAAPFVLAGIGFTTAGIAAGSLAASMMSSAAIASGGGVAAGSLVAILHVGCNVMNHAFPSGNLMDESGFGGCQENGTFQTALCRL
uniref:Uncharacterized protein n=1 Tax=Myripristis murdjan TaxID=586833 RepID=A0A667WKG5_9TELE